MESAETELENRIYEIGSRLASPPSDVHQLLNLLDQTESLLARVDQSPSQTMTTALSPATKSLVSKELLEHSDTDVSVAVASCISEITRITAPDAPYDDDLMKAIFQIIVDAFRNLDDIPSRSYSKRLLILETVAKVRSCVVMLDLECDSLILEMFQHFLTTIRPHHPGNVFSSMETIMTLVLEESEDISSKLLSCLLDSVKKDNDVLPIARKLGEKVITKCATKLKPYLMEVVQSLCSREYSKIIASICQDNSNSLEHTEIIVSGEILTDDSKLSERTVSDGLPEGSTKLGQEVPSPDKIGSTDNGVVQIGNEELVEEPTSPKQNPERSLRSVQSKSNIASDEANLDNLESVGVELDRILDLKSKKKRRRKGNKPVQGTNATDHSQNHGDKEGCSKNEDSSKMDPLSGKEAESAVCSGPRQNIHLQPTDRSDNGTVSVSPPTSEYVEDAGRPKRGRPRSKGSLKKVTDNSDVKSLKRSRKNFHSENVVDDVKPTYVTSDSEGKPSEQTSKKGSRENIVEKKSSQEQQKSNIKQPKRNTTRGKDTVGEMSLKDEPSTKSDTKIESKDEDHLKDSSRTLTRGKRARGADKEIIDVSEQPETSDHKTKLALDLVGSKIRVWWPDDKKFYSGKVVEFYPDSGKHKIVYDDGEVEKLLLKDEKYELIKGGSETEGQTKDDPSSAAREGPRSKRSKANSDSGTKQAPKDDTPLKSSGMESVKLGRPKGSVNKPKCETLKTPKLDGSSETSTKDVKDGKSRSKLKDDSIKADTPMDESVDGMKKSALKGKAKAKEVEEMEKTPPKTPKTKTMGRPRKTPKTGPGGASDKGKENVKEKEKSPPSKAEERVEVTASTGSARGRRLAANDL